MAINFTKEPSGIYPAYNDAFVVLNSDIESNYKLEIASYPSELFPKNFISFPDLEGNYLFNLKEVLKVVFNQYGFASVDFEDGVFWGSFKGSFLSQKFDFILHNDEGTEAQEKTFNFYKGVKQVGETVFENQQRLMSYSEDGINHDLTYFEGFPFSFSVLNIKEGSSVVLKRRSIGFETEEIEVFSSNSFKFIVDDGVDNWTNKNILPLITGLNEVELFVDNEFKTNVSLNKKKKSKGVCLRWFNNEGEFSYFVFDEFYKEDTRSKSLGRVYGTSFENIQDSTGNSKSKGKEVSGAKNVKARLNSKEYKVVKSILSSPNVQIYTSEEAFVKGRFIDVDIDGRISYKNKKGNNEISLTIDFLPEETIKL